MSFSQPNLIIKLRATLSQSCWSGSPFLLYIFRTIKLKVLVFLYSCFDVDMDEQIHALSKRITALEEKAAKKAGRKRQTFYLDGAELTDEDLVYYIKYDYFTIPELERLVGAKKNQLRNRYNRIISKWQKRISWFFSWDSCSTLCIINN